MVGCLVGWLVGQSVGLLLSWCVGQLVSRSIGHQSVGRSVSWSVDHLVDWLIGPAVCWSGGLSDIGLISPSFGRLVMILSLVERVLLT